MAEAVARGEPYDPGRDVVLDAISTAGRAYRVVLGTAQLLDDGSKEPLPADGNHAATASAAAKVAEFAARTATEGEAESVENASQAWGFAVRVGDGEGKPVRKELERDLMRLLHGKPLGRIRQTPVNPKKWWQLWKR